MAQNKETSIGIRLVSDLRNYQKNLSEGQKQTRRFGKNVRREVGEVGQAFTRLMRGDITALPAFFRAATRSAKGMAGGLKAVKAALIATGIGALLVALGTAVGALTQYFKNTEEGEIAFKKVMNNIKAYTEPVLQMFGRFGKAIMELFKGDFKQAWETAKGAVNDVGDAVNANKEQVAELNQLEENYIKNKRKFSLENKKLEADVAEARLKAYDEEQYSAAERARYIQQAIDRQRELAANEQKLADQELKIAEMKASFGDNDIETNDQLVELRGRQFDISRSMNTALRRMVRNQQTINRELDEEVEKQAVINKQMELRANNKGMSTITTRQDFELGATQTPTDQLDDMGNRMEATTQKAREMNAAFAEISSEESREAVGILSQQFSQLGGSIGGVAGHFLNLGSTMLELIPQLIAQVAALTSAQVSSSQSVTAAKSSEAIASGTASSQSLPFPLNIVALAVTLGSIISALATKPPKMASGGIAYGDSLVNVGEYSNARVNPEVIAPLDKLQGMLDKGRSKSSEPEVFIPDTRLRGEDIVISYNRAATRINRRT